MLANLARLAAPGARLLGLGTDPYATTTPEHLAYHESNQRRGRIPGQLRIRVRHGNVATGWFDYLLASVSELRPPCPLQTLMILPAGATAPAFRITGSPTKFRTVPSIA